MVRHLSPIIITLLGILAVCSISLTFVTQTAFAETPEGSVRIVFNDPEEVRFSKEKTGSLWFTVCTDKQEAEVSLSTSDPSVVTIQEADLDGEVYRGEKYCHCSYAIHKPGKAKFIVECDGVTAELPLYAYGQFHKVSEIKMSGYQKVRLKWKKTENTDGYIIYQYTDEAKARKNPDQYIVKQIEGADTLSAVVRAEVGKEYQYRIRPFYYTENGGIQDSNHWSSEVRFTNTFPKAVLTSVKVTGKKNLVSWEPAIDAAGYEVCRSRYEEDGYKKVKSVYGGACSCQDGPEAGTVWYYKVRPVFADHAAGDLTDSYAQMIPGKKKKARKITNKKVSDSPYSGTLYTAGKSLYFAFPREKRERLELLIYRINENYKVLSARKVKIPMRKGFEYGGMYHGPDGNYYVAVGYTNYKDKENKTVVQIYKFNRKWKKTGVASAKPKNLSLGVSDAFSFNRPAAFTMQGKYLVMHTQRHHFQFHDGLRHQSNLSVLMNTETMKAACVELGNSYTSHSFQQFAGFKGDSLYLADLGDGYPRAIHVSICDHFGTDAEEDRDYETFRFRGAIGNNTTGTRIAGMEVGRNNIVITGTSVPHGHAVKGIKGFNNRSRNLFANIIDAKTGKSKVIWLTKYNPKKKDRVSYRTAMVKLNEDRFAVMAAINNRLHYYVINEKGQQIKHLKYGKVNVSYLETFATDACVYKGNIFWAGESNSSGTENRLFRIPAIW